MKKTNTLRLFSAALVLCLALVPVLYVPAAAGPVPGPYAPSSPQPVEEADPSYLIFSSATEGGSISPAGILDVPAGKDKIFDMVADEGYRLARVLIDHKDIDVTSRYVFKNIESNHYIRAIFEKTPPPRVNPPTGAAA